LPGDGIGPEVMSEALKVLKGVLPSTNDLRVEYIEHPLGAGYYKRTGEILPVELIEECQGADAVLLAAIGLPDVRLPDGTEVQPHQVVGLRKALDQNLTLHFFLTKNFSFIINYQLIYVKFYILQINLVCFAHN